MAQQQSGFNLANVLGILNEMLESQERREEKDAQFELAKVVEQRDAFESDRDYRLKVMDKIRVQLNELELDSIKNRHGKGSEFYQQHLGAAYEDWFSEGAEGYDKFVDFLKKKDVGFNEYDAGRIASMVYNAGSNPDDMSSTVAFMNMFKEENANPDGSWEQSLALAGIAPDPFKRDIEGGFITNADGQYLDSEEWIGFVQRLENFNQSHQELQRIKEQQKAFRQVNPLGIENLADYDITSGMFDVMSDDDDDDDDDDDNEFGDNQKHFENIKEMSYDERKNYFQNVMNISPVLYETGDDKQDLNLQIASMKVIEMESKIQEFKNTMDINNPDDMAYLTLLEFEKDMIQKDELGFQQDVITKFKEDNDNDDDRVSSGDGQGDFINWGNVKQWGKVGRFYKGDYAKVKTVVNKISNKERQLKDLKEPSRLFPSGVAMDETLYFNKLERYNEKKNEYSAELTVLREDFNKRLVAFNIKHSEDFDANEFIK